MKRVAASRLMQADVLTSTNDETFMHIVCVCGHARHLGFTSEHLRDVLSLNQDLMFVISMCIQYSRLHPVFRPSFS